MKKEVKKIIINFSDLQKKCDSDYQKLSDKCKNYELSHNRKLKLLEKINNHWEIKKVENIKTTDQMIDHTIKWKKIVDEIKREINAPLRVRVKSEPKDIFYWKGARDIGIIPTRENNIFTKCKVQSLKGKENV